MNDADRAALELWQWTQRGRTRRWAGWAASMVLVAVAIALAAGSGGGEALTLPDTDALRGRLRGFKRGDPFTFGGAILKGGRWVNNGALTLTPALTVGGDNLPVPVSLAGSSLVSLRRVTKPEAKANYLPRSSWIAEIAHENGVLNVAADLVNLALLGVILRWTPPTARWPLPRSGWGLSE